MPWKPTFCEVAICRPAPDTGARATSPRRRGPAPRAFLLRFSILHRYEHPSRPDRSAPSGMRAQRAVDCRVRSPGEEFMHRVTSVLFAAFAALVMVVTPAAAATNDTAVCDAESGKVKVDVAIAA